MKFYTDYNYTNRETKAKYTWLKYKSILQGKRILDVGADKCFLKNYIDDQTTYWGIGLGGSPDQQINLEKEPLPFANGAFDVLLCLDVLEHVDNIHAVFDELCRVSASFVIISLPNPWATFYSMLSDKDYKPGIPTKFYGLPVEPPDDRHKWFFSLAEAENFITYRAKKNGLTVVQMDCQNEPIVRESTLVSKIRRRLANSVIRPDLNMRNLLGGTVWAVLQKEMPAGDARVAGK